MINQNIRKITPEGISQGDLVQPHQNSANLKIKEFIQGIVQPSGEVFQSKYVLSPLDTSSNSSTVLWLLLDVLDK